MVEFRQRNIERSKTLGERLAKVREEAGYSLTDVEQATQIKVTYLQALETGQYTKLPGSVYVENYLKRYATFLKVDPAYVIELYRQREQRVTRAHERQRFTPKPQEMPREVLTPRLLRRLIVGAIVVAALIYIVVIVFQVFAPPMLTVTSPADAIRVQDPDITVTGSTEPETSVTINGREIFLDADGNFSANLSLTEGINTITISSQKKRSKPTVETRTVLLEPQTEE